MHQASSHSSATARVKITYGMLLRRGDEAPCLRGIQIEAWGFGAPGGGGQASFEFRPRISDEGPNKKLLSVTELVWLVRQYVALMQALPRAL